LGTSRTLAASGGDQFPHRVELVVARKDHGLSGHDPDAAPAVLDLFLLRFEEREVAQKSEAKGLPLKLESMSQNTQRALGVQFFDEHGQPQGFQPRCVERPQFRPELRLRLGDKCEHLGREQRPVVVPLRVGAGLPADARPQDVLQLGLERSLVGLAHAVALSSSVPISLSGSAVTLSIIG